MFFTIILYALNLNLMAKKKKTGKIAFPIMYPKILKRKSLFDIYDKIFGNK